jgi:hypothetical protein
MREDYIYSVHLIGFQKSILDNYDMRHFIKCHQLSSNAYRHKEFINIKLANILWSIICNLG